MEEWFVYIVAVLVQGVEKSMEIVNVSFEMVNVSVDSGCLSSRCRKIFGDSECFF
jgi:hypothetical protein